MPTIAVIIGEGGSEGALPLAVADRVLMLQNSFYSAVSPEEAAELMFRDESKADRAAESLRLTAHDCYKLGIVDSVIQEPAGGAHLNPQEMARHLRRVLLKELADLQSKSRRRVQRERYKKFRDMASTVPTLGHPSLEKSTPFAAWYRVASGGSVDDQVEPLHVLRFHPR